MIVEVREQHAGGWKTTQTLGPFDEPAARLIGGAILKSRDCTKDHRCAYPFKDCNAKSGAVIYSEDQ